MTTPWILHQQLGRVLTLTLHRPQARNALSTPCLQQLVERLEQAEADDDTGAVVIAGGARFLPPAPTCTNCSSRICPPPCAIRVRCCGSGWPSSASRCWRRSTAMRSAPAASWRWPATS